MVWTLCLAVSLLLDRRPPGHGAFRLFGPVVALVAATIAVAAMQVWPGTLFGSPDPAWADAALLLGTAPEPRISATLANPILALGPVALLAMAVLRSYSLCRDPAAADRLVKLIAWTGVIIAAYGILTVLLDARLILWRERTAYLNNVTGTFINRNTAGTYFGSCAVLWLLLCSRRVDRVWPDLSVRRVELVFRLTQRRMLPAYWTIATLLFMVGATAMSGSRAGLLSTLIALTAAILLRYRRHLRNVQRRFWILALGLLAGMVVIQVLSAGIVARFERNGAQDPLRVETYRITLSMIADHPWLGIGLGNFEAVFPRYRTDALLAPGVWDRAHSTWLEIAATAGLPIAAACVALAIRFGVTLLRASLRRREGSLFPIAGFSVGLLGCLHSCVDFSLQIPGYAVVWAALVGCGLAQRKRLVSLQPERRGRGLPVDRERGSEPVAPSGVAVAGPGPLV